MGVMQWFQWELRKRNVGSVCLYCYGIEDRYTFSAID